MMATSLGADLVEATSWQAKHCHEAPPIRPERRLPDASAYRQSNLVCAGSAPPPSSASSREPSRTKPAQPLHPTISLSHLAVSILHFAIFILHSLDPHPFRPPRRKQPASHVKV
jgi:hypothetical protein